MRRRPTTRSCASARASRWRSSPIRRTISRSRPPTISGSPRRWRVSCGERRSLPDGRGSDGRPSSGGGASPSGRADRLSDGNGVWPGFAGAGPGRPGGGTPEGPAARQAVPFAGRRPRHGGSAGPRVQRVRERAGTGLLARAAHAGTPGRERPTAGRVARPGRRDRGALDVASRDGDRKSTRLNSSHLVISYAVFCLKKKKSKSAVIVAFDHQDRVLI